jgi:oxygen-dependent protoporphyrinogen oxidase
MSAAHRLQEAGARVVLLEKAARLGGIVQTAVEDGFVVEGGPDSFVAAKGQVLDLAEELGLGGEVIAANEESRGSFVWWDGRLHPLPGGLLLMVPSRLAPFLRSSLLSWRGRAEALKDLFVPRSAAQDDESLGSFVRRRLGREVLERIAEPLIAGIHAADPETMSLRASFPRFLEMEERHRSLILAARRAAIAPPTAVSSHFASFRLGMGQLTGAQAAALGEVDVRTNADVNGVEATDAGFVVSLEEGGRISVPMVVMAVPAPVATRLLGSVSPEASAAISGIGQVRNQAVTLAYRSDQLPALRGSGFVVPSTHGSVVRGVSYLSRKWEGRVPTSDSTLLRVFLAAGRSVENPVETARTELTSMVGVTAEPTDSWVRTHHEGLHRYTVGHMERIAAAERALASSPGIALAGAGFYGVGLNECIESGRAAAESVMLSHGVRQSGAPRCPDAWSR